MSSGEDSSVYVGDHEGISQCDSYVSYHQTRAVQEISDRSQEFLVLDGPCCFVDTRTETHGCLLRLDLLGDSSCLVVIGRRGLDWSLDWVYLLVTVVVNVTHVFVCELMFPRFCVHLHVRVH